jgi:hypothetical protein
MLFSAEQNRTDLNLPVVKDNLLEKRKNVIFFYNSPKGITQKYITGLERTRGIQKVEAPRFQDIRHTHFC